MERVVEHSLVVRNTFIDAREVPSEEDAPPPRTRSDPTGYGEPRVLPLKGIPPPQPITVQEGTSAEEAGVENDNAQLEEEDDDAPMTLARTISSGYAVAATNLGNARKERSGDQRENSEDGLIKLTEQVLSHLLTDPNQHGRTGNGKAKLELSRRLPGDESVKTTGIATASPQVGLVPVAVPVQHLVLPSPDGTQPWGYMPPWGYGEYGYMAHVPLGTAGVSQPAPTSQRKIESNKIEPKRKGGDGQQDSSPSDSRPPLCTIPSAPPAGTLHSFHQETAGMGAVSPDWRYFTKMGFEGRLSVVSESQVHVDGCHRYLVQFTSGELSRADGVGFVFSPRLPCAKNIQRIVSIFVNKGGRICMRVFADIVRASACVKPIELGDWVDMAVDLDKKVAIFNIWPRTALENPETAQPISSAEFSFGDRLGHMYTQTGQKNIKLNMGHLAVVVKNVDVSVTLAS